MINFAAVMQPPNDMPTYSNEDFENFYIRYKAEGLPLKMTIQEYCLRNKVQWNLFNKWYRDTRHRISEVTVTGRPESQTSSPDQIQLTSDDTSDAERSHDIPPTEATQNVRIKLDLWMSNGLHISQKNLSYQKLSVLIKNLEVLC